MSIYSSSLVVSVSFSSTIMRKVKQKIKNRKKSNEKIRKGSDTVRAKRKRAHATKAERLYINFIKVLVQIYSYTIVITLVKIKNNTLVNTVKVYTADKLHSWQSHVIALWTMSDCTKRYFPPLHHGIFSPTHHIGPKFPCWNCCLIVSRVAGVGWRSPLEAMSS